MIYDADTVIKPQYGNIGLFSFWNAVKLPLYIDAVPNGETAEVYCNVLYNPYTTFSSDMDFLFGSEFHSTLDKQQGRFLSEQGWIIPHRALDAYKRKFPGAELISFSDATIAEAKRLLNEKQAIITSLSRSYISDYQKRTQEKKKFAAALSSSKSILIEEHVSTRRNGYLLGKPPRAEESYSVSVGKFTAYFAKTGSSLYHQYKLTGLMAQYSDEYKPNEIVLNLLNSVEIQQGGLDYDLSAHLELQIYESIFRYSMRFQVYRLLIPEAAKVEKDPNWNAYVVTTGWYRIRFVMILKDQPQQSNMSDDIGEFMTRIYEENIAVLPGSYIGAEGSVADNFFFWPGESNENFPDKDNFDPF